MSYKLALARYRDRDVDAALAARRTRPSGSTIGMADAYYLLGICLREKRRTSDALPALEKAVALAPGLIPAREELADAVRRRSAAAATSSSSCRCWPGSIAITSSGRWRSAWRTRAPATGISPCSRSATRSSATRTNRRSTARSAQVWLERPRDDRAFLSKAREALERAAASPSASSDVLTLVRARAAAGGRESRRPSTRCSRRRAAIRSSRPAFLLYASAAEKQNHLDAARNALILYGSVVPEDRDFAARASRIAALSLRLNDPDTAVEWLDQAASASPNDTKLIALLAEAQLKAGDTEAASASIERGLAKDPVNAALRSLKLRADAIKSRR